MRLVRLMLVLCVLIMMGIGAARIIGHSQPVPASIQELRLLDCKLPCWIGIVPGYTRLQTAESQLAQVFTLPNYKLEKTRSSPTWTGANIDFELIKTTDPAEVNFISIEVVDDVVERIAISGPLTPTLGELTSVLGVPKCVSTGFVGSDFLMLYYSTDQSSTISAEIDVGPTRWTLPVLIQFFRPQFEDCSRSRSWRGLASARRYWQFIENTR